MAVGQRGTTGVGKGGIEFWVSGTGEQNRSKSF